MKTKINPHIWRKFKQAEGNMLWHFRLGRKLSRKTRRRARRWARTMLRLSDKFVYL